MNAKAKELVSILTAMKGVPKECSDCATFCQEGHISVPCNGDFPKDCMYKDYSTYGTYEGFKNCGACMTIDCSACRFRIECDEWIE